MDSLPVYNVTVVDNKVKVQAKKSTLGEKKRMKRMAKRDPGNNVTYLVLGGGR